MRQINIMSILALACLLIGCQSRPPNTPSNTLPSPEASEISPTFTENAAPAKETQAPAEHVIGARTVDGVTEFYDVNTGETFVPRGTNYVRLEQQIDPTGHPLLFQAAWNPEVYDARRTNEAFAAIEANGYNVIRIFINHCCETGIGASSGGLTPEYLDNLADMLRLAKAHHLYVMITTADLPKYGGYFDILNQDCCERFAHYNVQFLSSAGLRGTKVFWEDLVTGLIEHDAPLDAIWAYSLANEAFFREDFPPLSLNEGLIETANGQTYDMSDPQQKEQMLSDNLLHYIATTRDTIRELDPTALVTIGFFWPKGPNPARGDDPRIVRTARVIAESGADFIDLHPYPGEGLTFDQAMENFGVTPGEDHLLVLGEYGVREVLYEDAADAARALQAWQVESCEYGFDGWLTWTWDTFEQEGFFTELSGDESIREALSPLNRPDPCAYSEDFQLSITENATVTVSANLIPGEPPEAAIDGDSSTLWGAGAPPYQWIQVDLGSPAIITEIRLQVSQSPAGATAHRIIGIMPGGAQQVIAELNGVTDDLQWLTVTPDEPLSNIQIVRIETTSSPSWVAWREIQIYGQRDN